MEQEPGKVGMHQEKYCNDILKRFQQRECRPISNPTCEPNMHLSDADCPRMENRDPEVIRSYQAEVGLLMYLTCFTRGNCSFAVNQCSRLMSNTGPSHITAACRMSQDSQVLGRDALARDHLHQGWNGYEPRHHWQDVRAQPTDSQRRR